MRGIALIRDKKKVERNYPLRGGRRNLISGLSARQDCCNHRGPRDDDSQDARARVEIAKSIATIFFFYDR